MINLRAQLRVNDTLTKEMKIIRVITSKMYFIFAVFDFSLL